MSAQRGSGLHYDWWPRPPLRAVTVGDRSILPQAVLSAAVVTAVFWLPVVRRATGIDPRWVAGLISAHVVWSTFVAFALTKPKEGFRSRRALNVGMAGNLLLNTGICVALSVLGGEPRTPLW